MSDELRCDDYKVGYGKPPRHSQFKPGHSGNPSGKRKPKPSFMEELSAILEEKVTVTEGGRARRLPRREIIARQLVTKAMTGDTTAQKIVLPLLKAVDSCPSTDELAAADAYILDELIRMVGDEVEQP